MRDVTVKQLIKQRVQDSLDYGNALSDEQLIEQIEQIVFAYSRESFLTAGQKQTLVQEVFHSFRGLDVLQPLVDDRTITEIMINSHDQIFVEKDGRVLETDIRFESREKLEDTIQAVVGRVNRIVNESTPIVDARLADGSRVNVVLPPIALKGPAMTIRKFPEHPLTLDDLIARQALSREAADQLIRFVKAKYNLFIGGGTGSGKTTFLNALGQYIPPDERVITIEDSAELQIRGVPNLVSLETRNANTEGKGGITIRDLIRSSLRMRPNRIIVGEVRGAEALDMLAALNTGHEGSLSTGHANSVQDMLSRLETMVLSGASLPVEVARKQIASAIDVMIHLTRLRDRSRRVTEITEVIGVDEGEVKLNPLYRFVETGETSDGKVIGQLEPTGNELAGTWKLEMAGLI
ncbi:CpaF family protein [Paenibacillus ehimensis]|uniref:CpaF family protein n=1 Tax=Paenibacillus ehimensis TaxID=79264 RepID=A0ABT8VGI7_9BACL|nr:CpaF family protein [Paenibacillus ehimensis]MDO3680078.1 CpaF family protein [Paenibacillus ehimensis]MEC0212104.1 CpaF family protein [Paenibacillus ehimensis]